MGLYSNSSLVFTLHSSDGNVKAYLHFPGLVIPTPLPPNFSLPVSFPAVRKLPFTISRSYVYECRPPKSLKGAEAQGEFPLL